MQHRDPVGDEEIAAVNQVSELAEKENMWGESVEWPDPDAQIHWGAQSMPATPECKREKFALTDAITQPMPGVEHCWMLNRSFVEMRTSQVYEDLSRRERSADLSEFACLGLQSPSWLRQKKPHLFDHDREYVATE